MIKLNIYLYEKLKIFRIANQAKKDKVCLFKKKKKHKSTINKSIICKKRYFRKIFNELSIDICINDKIVVLMLLS